MTSSRYAAIILAAGLSTRMEPFKPLLRIGEKDRLVSLDERFRTSNRRFPVTPEIETVISQRKARALTAKSEIESLLGYSPDEIISLL